MCETCDNAADGWVGWLDLPPQGHHKPVGEWIDLSYSVDPEMPYASIFPQPSLTKIRQMPKDPFNVTELQMVVHVGTHIDAPRHYYLDGPAFEDIPLDRFHGAGVVWHLPVEPETVIGVEDLKQMQPTLKPGDILAIDTGWADRFGTPDYDRHPSLSAQAATWLLEQKIKMLACDFATPDLVYNLREPGFDWPVHRILLSHGILICEHLRGHAALAGKRVEFMMLPLNITGSDGAPVRAVARAVA